MLDHCLANSFFGNLSGQEEWLDAGANPTSTWRGGNWSTRTRVNSFLSQLVPIFCQLVPVVWSTRNPQVNFGQLVPSLVNSYLVKIYTGTDRQIDRQVGR